MKKKELIRRVNDELRVNGHKKPVAVERHVLHVSDDDGNSTDFVIKERGRDAIYTSKDVEKILDACCSVILKALENGEEINYHGFGTFKVRVHPPQNVFHVKTRETIEIAPYCTLQFVPGTNLKSAVKVYERTSVRSKPYSKEGGS